MITMKEQADQFRKILHFSKRSKSATPNGIQIPYKDLANVCVEFTTGECYSFFGNANSKALFCWKTNLLLKLLQNGVSVCVLEGGDVFRRDFAELACLQAKIDPDTVLSDNGSVEDMQRLTVALKEIVLLPMVWMTEKNIPSNLKNPVVCVKNMMLDEWQNKAETLWKQACQNKVVLILFVRMPHTVPLSFDRLYHPHKIIVPENLSSYVSMVKTMDLPVGSQHMSLELTIKQTESFMVHHLDFDLDPHSREISVPSHI